MTAPLGAIWPQDPLGSELGGTRHSCVAAVLSRCLVVHLPARSDLSLSLFSPPSFTVPVPHARLFVYSVLCLLSLSLSFPLVHGGKGIRFTLSEEIYPEKGTCAAHLSLHLPAAAGLG